MDGKPGHVGHVSEFVWRSNANSRTCIFDMYFFKYCINLYMYIYIYLKFITLIECSEI